MAAHLLLCIDRSPLAFAGVRVGIKLIAENTWLLSHSDECYGLTA